MRSPSNDTSHYLKNIPKHTYIMYYIYVTTWIIGDWWAQNKTYRVCHKMGRRTNRWMDYIIIFGSQIWPMRPQILHLMWYVWKWVVTLDVQELCKWMLQWRVHIVVVREIRASIGLGWRDVESMVEYDQRQSIVSKCDTKILELV